MEEQIEQIEERIIRQFLTKLENCQDEDLQNITTSYSGFLNSVEWRRSMDKVD